MSTLIYVEKVSKLDIPYYLGSFDTNYIDSRNVGVFKHTFFKEQNFVEEILNLQEYSNCRKEIFKINYLI
jgi:hypothetical protein